MKRSLRLSPQASWGALLTTGALLLAGCAGDPATPPSTTPALAERLAPLSTFLQGAVDDRTVAGALALVESFDRSERYFEVFGHMNLEEDRAMDRDAIFRIASMTKPLTSAAVMMLIEEGALGLEDPISDYLPEWSAPVVIGPPDSSGSAGYTTVPASAPITVRHLLTHTSGVSYRFMVTGAMAELYDEAGVYDGVSFQNTTLADQSQRLAGVPLMNQPGEAFAYGLNTDLLGYIVEVVSGQRLDAFLEERVFTPLGMNDTRFFAGSTERPRIVDLYRPGEGGALARVPDAGVDVTDAGFIFAPDLYYAGPQTYVSGGAGLLSTATDYSRFMQAMAHGGELDGARILGEATVAQMTQNQVGELREPFFGGAFGLGFGVYEDAEQAQGRGSPGTYYWGGIFKTHFWVDPEKKVVGVIMSQLLNLPSNFTMDAAEQAYVGLSEP